MLKKILFLIPFLITPLFALHNVELDVNDKTLNLELNIDVGQFDDYIVPNTTFFGARFMYRQNAYSDNHKLEPLYEFNTLWMEQIGNSGIEAGVGLKFDYLNVKNQISNSTATFMAIPIGVHLGYYIPWGLSMPLKIAGLFYYSPEVLTFDQGKNWYEYEAFIQLNVTQRAGFLAGYREIEPEFQNFDISYVNAWFVGVEFKF